MSAKLPRDAAAFAQRVKMSRNRLFLLVEGQDVDSRFYDQLLRSSGQLDSNGYVVQLGELVSIGGSVAGGKRHLEKLHDYFRTHGQLKQSNSSNDRLIAFALDKDLADISGRMKRSAHVVYTQHADAEAEIFAHCRLKKTVAAALSLTSADARALVRKLGDPLDGLASIWSDWLGLCFRVEGTSSRCGVKISRPSKVNDPLYGR